MGKVKAFLVAIVVVVLYQFIIPESIFRWAINLTYYRGWLTILIVTPILIHLFSCLLPPIQAGVIWSIRKCTSNNAEVGFTMRIIAVGMILTRVMSVCSLWMARRCKRVYSFSTARVCVDCDGSSVFQSICSPKNDVREDIKRCNKGVVI